jgi:hypothetical protein
MAHEGDRCARHSSANPVLRHAYKQAQKLDGFSPCLFPLKACLVTLLREGRLVWPRAAPIKFKDTRLEFYLTRTRIYAMTLSHEVRKLGTVEGEYRYDELEDSAPKLI